MGHVWVRRQMYTGNCGGKSERKIPLETSSDIWSDIFRVDLKEIRLENIDLVYLLRIRVSGKCWNA
jgi:hypothetical protein